MNEQIENSGSKTDGSTCPDQHAQRSNDSALQTKKSSVAKVTGFSGQEAAPTVGGLTAFGLRAMFGRARMAAQWSLDGPRGLRIGSLLVGSLIWACSASDIISGEASTPPDASASPDASTPALDSGDASTGNVDGSVRPYAWNEFLGAHYQPRTWARGGLRGPGGTGGDYQPHDQGGTISDPGLANFERGAVPVLRDLLQRGEYAVLLVGGVYLDTPFFKTIETPVGKAAFAKALEDRIDLIQAMPEAKGWESHIVFQFGNEIQNPEKFYGGVCLWATAGKSQDCDLETEFAPAYVDLYLAPGVEILRRKSQGCRSSQGGNRS